MSEVDGGDKEHKKSSSQNNSLLENENITQAILAISFPMMVTGFSDALYNMVDSIFVGRFIGEKALAALAVNSSIQIILIALAGLYGGGMTSIISRALGAQNTQKVNNTLVNGVFLCIVSTTLLSLIMLFFLDPILTFIGSPEEVLKYSREYGQVILWFGFLVPTNGVLSGVLRAKGEVKYIMYLALLGAVLNMALDALFIIVFGWGVRGAALATILAQLIVLCLLFMLIAKLYRIQFRFYYFQYMTWSLVSEIYSIGISNFLRSSVFAVMGVSANRALAPYGVAAIASFGIVNRILHLAYQPIFGSNLATQALIGYNYGANRFIKVNKIIIKGITLATFFGIIPSLCFIWAPEPLFRLFTDVPEILSYTKTASRIVGTTFFLYGIQIFSTGALVAMGHPKEALFLSLFRPCLMVLCMNILPQFFGVTGVWFTFPVTDTISTSVTLYIISKELLALKKREEALKTLSIH